MKLLERARRLLPRPSQVKEIETSVATLGTNLAIVAAGLGRMSEDPSRDAWQPLRGGACSQRWCEGPTYRSWCERLREPVRYQRKQWEKIFVTHHLQERGLLAEGKRGLGFGVGAESLPSFFAGLGCHVMATDQAPQEAQRTGWAGSGFEYVNTLDALNTEGFCDPALFRERVSLRAVDMNAVPQDLTDFDFCWSCCALEHLGSIEAGLRFVERSVACLRPGGLAVHTLEYNLDSNDDTVTSGPTVLFRRRDIEHLVGRLERAGHQVLPIDWSTGDALLDDFVDTPPYCASCHLRLRLSGYRCTSFGIAVIRGA